MTAIKKWWQSAWGSKAIKIEKMWQESFANNPELWQVIVSDLAMYCFINQSTFVAGKPDETAFREGSRDVFLHLLSIIKIDEKLVLNWLQTNQLTLDTAKESINNNQQ